MQNVSADGTVDFAHLRAYPRRLNEYLGQLEKASPENDPAAFPTHEDQTAYWINAHNAIALRLILNHFPANSLTEVPDLETNTHYKLGGKSYNLSQIRAKALRFDASLAIMLTMTNYSVDAPPISAQAYEGKSLKTLSAQARQNALQSTHFIRFQRISGNCVSLQLSPFFQGFQAALFPPPSEDEAEDQDGMAEEQAQPSNPAPMSWTELLKPYAPPSLYSDLGQSCSQNVEFQPANSNLRWLQLLRS